MVKTALPAVPSVVIAAGGTGGHIYPGLALADAILALEPAARVEFVGTTRGLERELIPAAGYRLHLVGMIPFDPDIGARRFLLPAHLLHATHQARRVLAGAGACVAVGMGGFPSSPVILAGRSMALPTLIHESNAVPGRANRLNAQLATEVCLGFADARDRLPRRRRENAEVVGMPLHAPLTRAARSGLRAAARAEYRLRPGQRLILVNGGSQGARTLTESAAGLAGRWRERADVRLLIKTGPGSLAETRARLAANGGDAVAEACAYLERMDLAYAAADLAVCRAGSATVAELATCGLPAVLVPFPHAPGDHQRHNAHVLTRRGAALLVDDARLDPAGLAAALEPLLADPARLDAMSTAAAPGPHTTAAATLAERVLALAGPTAVHAKEYSLS
jgi:UDP-N-acetylglucosamine--N-acetylmuramyl-(pentapeptide) pyrophosphoryl-undecaprenol N-acetylglucosamine transferase